MPYVEGASLRHEINREKQIAVEEAVEIGTSVVENFFGELKKRF
jgi:hypothetical protein